MDFRDGMTSGHLTGPIQLNDKEKAATAASLIESLDPSLDENVESAWQAKIQRRLHEIQTKLTLGEPFSRHAMPTTIAERVLTGCAFPLAGHERQILVRLEVRQRPDALSSPMRIF
jgi:hypothetical protein